VVSSCAPIATKDFSLLSILRSAPKEVLEYLVTYVKDTPAINQMPLYQVLHQLSTTNPQGLPDLSAILPYIGLYTIVHLKSTELRDVTYCTPFSPPLSILRNGQWENAPTRTASTAPNVAYIFDPLAVYATGQRPSPSLIPLHPDHRDYPQKRYWRLPRTSLGGILSAVVLCAINSPSTADDELEMVRVLHRLLTLKKAGGVDAGLSGDAGPSGEGCREDERGGGRGGNGQWGTHQKREREDEEDEGNTRSSNKQHHC